MKGCVAALAALLAALLACPSSGTGEPDRTYSVGIKQVEFADTHYGSRTLSMAVFYPAAVNAGAATPFVMPFFTNLTLYKDAEVAFDGEKRLLIMLSHGRGSNGLSYAWFAQTLSRTRLSVSSTNCKLRLGFPQASDSHMSPRTAGGHGYFHAPGSCVTRLPVAGQRA
jgi:hypothetical protein